MEAVSGHGKRRLGDEWNDWNGAAEDAQTSAGKRLFVLLSALTLTLAGTLSVVAWYMVTPRLLQWHPMVPRALLLFLVLAALMVMAAQGVLVLSLLLGRPVPRRLRFLLRIFLGVTERKVLGVGQRLAMDRDRLAHSFIKVHNALERLDGEPSLTPDQLLVLLPRCLAKDQLISAREMCKELGAHVAVVAGGELARKRIKELRPRAIVGVACERDLLSGVRDVGGAMSVLGIPNSRPEGPCKDTVIPMDELREAIRFYTSR